MRSVVMVDMGLCFERFLIDFTPLDARQGKKWPLFP